MESGESYPPLFCCMMGICTNCSLSEKVCLPLFFQPGRNYGSHSIFVAVQFVAFPFQRRFDRNGRADLDYDFSEIYVHSNASSLAQSLALGKLHDKIIHVLAELSERFGVQDDGDDSTACELHYIFSIRASLMMKKS